jgi:hypothetical protein
VANAFRLICLGLILIAQGTSCGRAASKSRLAPLVVAGVSGAVETQMYPQAWNLVVTNQPVMEGALYERGWILRLR